MRRPSPPQDEYAAHCQTVRATGIATKNHVLSLRN